MSETLGCGGMKRQGIERAADWLYQRARELRLDAAPTRRNPA